MDISSQVGLVLPAPIEGDVSHFLVYYKAK